MLHQICMYLQIGRHNCKTLDRMHKMINEVYAAVRLQAVSDIQSTQPTLLAACVCRTQYAMWDKDVENRFEQFLKLLENAVDKIDLIISKVT